MALYLSKPIIAAIECALVQSPPIDLYEIAATFKTTYETVRYRQYQLVFTISFFTLTKAYLLIPF